MYLCFSLLGFFQLFIAVRGFTKKKPFLLPMRWNFYLFLPVFLVFLPSNLLDISLINWSGFLIMLVLLSFLWVTTKGYMVFGASDKHFRESLISVLKKTKIKYQEIMTGIRFVQNNIELKVIANWLGSGLIRAEGKNSGKLLSQLVKMLNKEFSNSKKRADFKSFYFQLALAVFILFLSFQSWYLFNQFPK
jgi:hypothetical protein